MKNKIVIMLIILIFFISCGKESMSPMGEPVKIVVSPSAVEMAKKESIKFSAVAYDRNNNYVDVDVKWSVESNYGEINNKGYFYIKNNVTAPYPKREYVVAEYNGITGRALVTVQLADFWIYSDVNTQDFMYDYPDPRPDFGGKLGVWGSCSLSDDTADFPEECGDKSLKIEYTGAGGCFWLFCDASWNATNENMIGYLSNGKLEFWVKATNNLEIKIEDDITGSSRYLSGYITLKNEWQKVSIPLKDFIGIDFTKIKTIVGFHSTTAGIAHIDEVCFTAE